MPGIPTADGVSISPPLRNNAYSGKEDGPRCVQAPVGKESLAKISCTLPYTSPRIFCFCPKLQSSLGIGVLSWADYDNIQHSASS